MAPIAVRRTRFQLSVVLAAVLLLLFVTWSTSQSDTDFGAVYESVQSLVWKAEQQPSDFGGLPGDDRFCQSWDPAATTTWDLENCWRAKRYQQLIDFEPKWDTR